MEYNNFIVISPIVDTDDFQKMSYEGVTRISRHDNSWYSIARVYELTGFNMLLFRKKDIIVAMAECQWIFHISPTNDIEHLWKYMNRNYDYLVGMSRKENALFTCTVN